MDEMLEPTPVENLYAELEVDKDSAFESFIIKHHQTFSHEVDMYGDIQKAGDSQLKVSNSSPPLANKVFSLFLRFLSSEHRSPLTLFKTKRK